MKRTLSIMSPAIFIVWILPKISSRMSLSFNPKTFFSKIWTWILTALLFFASSSNFCSNILMSFGEITVPVKLIKTQGNVKMLHNVYN